MTTKTKVWHAWECDCYGCRAGTTNKEKEGRVNYLARFKRHYEKALQNKRTQFSFDKQVVLVSYAKYYIEYLETVVLKRSEHGKSQEEENST